MKTDFFTLRMRLLTLVCSFAAVLLLMIPSLKPNASAVTPQGKGGEVIAKPTPKKPTTPKKVPPKKNSPASRQSSCSAQSPTQATGRRREVTLSGGVSLEMLEIPAGSFCMGSMNGEKDEKPVHQVTINYSFYMGRNEVTQAQWQAMLGNNPSHFKGSLDEPSILLPVEQVSWDDAQSFVNKLNERNDGFTYRLPTEAEWEYACRAGTTGDYAGNPSEMAWYSENSGGRTHWVGTKQPNAWNLFDMRGNVWEWCQDWYHDNYSGAPTDGSAWLSGGEQKYRLLRGGSWYNLAPNLRSAFRSVSTPAFRSYDLGFRVVAVVRTQ
jgi:formylglycine-generating enzyme required for sulfatase activity